MAHRYLGSRPAISFPLLILRAPWGGALFVFAGKVVQKLIQFSTDGTRFVFGPLADSDSLGKAFGPDHSLIFAILVTGTVIIVSALSSLFYHWGFCSALCAPPRGLCARPCARAAAKRFPPPPIFSWGRPRRR